VAPASSKASPTDERTGAGTPPGSEAADPGVAEGSPPAGSRFRVRVSQVSGPRSRRVEVEAADADAAAEAALASLGDGWKVLDVESS